MHSKVNGSMSGQRGVVLIVVLVILLAVTLLGTVVMQNATMQMRMVNNTQARQQAFNSAEAILSQGENFLATTLITDPFLRTFKADCTNGLCFSGVLPLAGVGEQPGCTLGTPPTTELWEYGNALDVWHTAGTKNVAVTPPNMSQAGMYIIEFRCFIDGLGGKVSGGNGDALFRVTARGVSENGAATVMVQSMYRASLSGP